MQRFFIQLRTESHVQETLEVEGEDYKSLKTEVAKFVGELLKSHAEAIWVDEDWRVDVTDDTGLILYVMQISAFEASATMSKPKTDM